MDLCLFVFDAFHALAPEILRGYFTAAYIEAARVTCPDCRCAPHIVCGGQGLEVVSRGQTVQCGWGFLPGFVAGAVATLLAVLAFQRVKRQPIGKPSINYVRRHQ